MKKVILLLCLFSVSVLWTEEYYLIKKQDCEKLQDLYSQLGRWAIKTGTAKDIRPIVEDLRRIYYGIERLNAWNQDIIERKSFSSDIDWDIVIKVLEDVSDDYKLDSQQRKETNKSITYLRTKIQNEHDDKNKMTLNEKLSILGGKISLLEMRIIQLEGKKK